MHIAQPLIVMWFLRRWKPMPLVLCANDALLIVAIFFLGWHYLVDLIGVLLLAILCYSDYQRLDLLCGRTLLHSDGRLRTPSESFLVVNPVSSRRLMHGVLRGHDLAAPSHHRTSPTLRSRGSAPILHLRGAGGGRVSRWIRQPLAAATGLPADWVKRIDAACRAGPAAFCPSCAPPSSTPLATLCLTCGLHHALARLQLRG
jgi:hypothetical protein